MKLVISSQNVIWSRTHLGGRGRGCSCLHWNFNHQNSFNFLMPKCLPFSTSTGVLYCQHYHMTRSKGI